MAQKQVSDQPSVQELIAKSSSKKQKQLDYEKLIPTILFLIASISVLTTIGIVAHFDMLKQLFSLRKFMC